MSDMDVALITSVSLLALPGYGKKSWKDIASVASQGRLGRILRNETGRQQIENGVSKHKFKAMCIPHCPRLNIMNHLEKSGPLSGAMHLHCHLGPHPGKCSFMEGAGCRSSDRPGP
jgi:hypothetical protein